jgi:hypothetical protein
MLEGIDNMGLVESQRSFTVSVYLGTLFLHALAGFTSNPDGAGFFSHPGEKVSYVPDVPRPISGVAHEVGHLCNRQRASAATLVTNSVTGVVSLSSTGAQPPIDDWPPDELGYLQGVGCDTTKGNMIYPRRWAHPETASLTPFYDFMTHALRMTMTAGFLFEAGQRLSNI